MKCELHKSSCGEDSERIFTFNIQNPKDIESYLQISGRRLKEYFHFSCIESERCRFLFHDFTRNSSKICNISMLTSQFEFRNSRTSKKSQKLGKAPKKKKKKNSEKTTNGVCNTLILAFLLHKFSPNLVLYLLISKP